MSDPSRRPDLVLFLAYPYPPCPDVGAVRPAHFARYLLRAGYNVRVITGYSDTPPRPESIFVPNRQRKPSRRTPGGLAEMALRKCAFPSDDAMVWTLDAVRAAGQALRGVRRATVFSTYPPLNSHLAAWMVKRRYGVRWVADFRDPLAGSPGREMTNSRIWYGALPNAVDRWAQRGIFRDADVLIANTDTVLERWRREFPDRADRMVAIWNGFDSEEMMTAAPVPARSRHVMAHAGAIYTGRHPGPLLAAMERMIARGTLDPSRFVVQLAGQIDWDLLPDREIFRRLGALGCLETPGLMPKTEAQRIVREADSLLLLDVIEAEGGQQLPSKIFEYITVGRPILVITTRNSPADRLLARSGIPYACIYRDSTAEEAERALAGMLAMSNEPRRASDWFFENFDAVHRTRALAEWL